MQAGPATWQNNFLAPRVNSAQAEKLFLMTSHWLYDKIFEWPKQHLCKPCHPASIIWATSSLLAYSAVLQGRPPLSSMGCPQVLFPRPDTLPLPPVCLTKSYLKLSSFHKWNFSRDTFHISYTHLYFCTFFHNTYYSYNKIIICVLFNICLPQ